MYIGMSLGVLPAQALAQNRPARAARSCCTASCRRWTSVPAQVHLMEDDEVGRRGPRGRRRAFGGELFLYPGSTHLFTDRSLPDYDEAAARQATERVLAFLERM